MKYTFLLLFIVISSFTNAQLHSIWGANQYEGPLGYGTVFKTDSVGNFLTVVTDFPENNGVRNPEYTQLVKFNGEFYGLSAKGGPYDNGIIFKYNPVNNTCTRLFDFYSSTTGNGPYGSLCLTHDSMLIGLTASGGNGGGGVLFKFNPLTSVFTKLIGLSSSVGGKVPYGTPIQARDSNLYFMTWGGGQNNLGTIVQYNVLFGSSTVKYSFNTANGTRPFGNLVEGKNGNLYGMTSAGGTNGFGTIFEYDPDTGNFIVHFHFSGIADGATPKGSLLADTNGIMYGMTSMGGANDMGVIFAFNDSTFQVNKLFDFDSLSNGSHPTGSLINGMNGNLFGLASHGAANNSGVLFEFNPITSQYFVRQSLDSNTTGGKPGGTLFLDTLNNKMYGLCGIGGANSIGTLFSYDPLTLQYQKKIDFDGSINGRNPHNSLVEGNDGWVYGTTLYGGKFNWGTMFRIDPVTHQFVKLYDFRRETGSNPIGAMVQATNGKFYGTAWFGGIHQGGSLYSFDPSTLVYTELVPFDDSTGKYPYDSPIEASNGLLYGLTNDGGSNTDGTIYKFDPLLNTFSVIHHFDGNVTGQFPQGRLVEVNGYLYGVTAAGGAHIYGTIFRLNMVTDSVEVLHDFIVRLEGASALGSLLYDGNNSLWGVTIGGGNRDLGIVFEYNIQTNTYSRRHDFVPAQGYEIIGTMLKGIDGKFYGAAHLDSINLAGTIFSFDPVSYAYTPLHFLDSTTTGIRPHRGALIQLQMNGVGIRSIDDSPQVTIYPNPITDEALLIVPEIFLGGEINIYDVEGRVILKKRITESEMRINMKYFAAGVYNLVVEKGKLRGKRKIVRQ